MKQTLFFLLIIFALTSCSAKDALNETGAELSQTVISSEVTAQPEKVVEPMPLETAVVLTEEESPPADVFYEEFGLTMAPDLLPKSAHEKELLCCLGAEIAKRLEEVPLKFEDAKKYSGILSTYFYEDFDSDGTCEMFAEVTLVASDATWFIDDEGAVLLDSSAASFSVEPPLLLDIQQQKFAVFKSYGSAASTMDYVYSVRDGKPYKVNTSSRMISGMNQYGEVLLEDTRYDAFIDGAGDILGRTWKPYYFYLDEAGSFKEYGGIEANLDFICTMKGAEAILQEHLPEEATIESIYYRNNGVVNINYYTKERGGKVMGYITLRYDGSQALLEAAERGIYLPAVLPDLAEYPASLPQFK